MNFNFFKPNLLKLLKGLFFSLSASFALLLFFAGVFAIFGASNTVLKIVQIFIRIVAVGVFDDDHIRTVASDGDLLSALEEAFIVDEAVKKLRRHVSFEIDARAVRFAEEGEKADDLLLLKVEVGVLDNYAEALVEIELAEIVEISGEIAFAGLYLDRDVDVFPLARSVRRLALRFDDQPCFGNFRNASGEFIPRFVAQSGVVGRRGGIIFAEGIAESSCVHNDGAGVGAEFI